MLGLQLLHCFHHSSISAVVVERLPLLNLPPHWFTGLGGFFVCSCSARLRSLKTLQGSEECWKELLINCPVFPDIAPMYSNLFALLREDDRTWFPPNHVFKASQSASENLQFRLRYIRRTFPLFHPQNPFFKNKSNSSGLTSCLDTTSQAGITTAVCCIPTVTERPKGRRLP